MTDVPHNPDVESAVVAGMLADPSCIGEVVGTLLEPGHFHTAAGRLLYGAVVEAFYADDPVDALVIGELQAKRLAPLWGVDEKQAVRRLQKLAGERRDGSVVDHARLVKRDADYRMLLELADEIRTLVESEDQSPEEIAGVTSQGATKIATSSLNMSELVSFADTGRQFIKELRTARAAREQGVELGAYFGIKAIDNFTRGLQPTEVLVSAGEPGVGKSAVWWRAALNFAERQSRRPPQKQVGTLILSMEMAPTPSNVRFASMLTGLSGIDLREGDVDDAGIDKLVDAWRRRADLPLHLNYAPNLRASQLRALVSEAIRKFNVGVVVLDHFRMFDLDRRLRNPIDEDEEKARFLKEQIARDLNVAVICLAHTRKPDAASNGRPRLSDLRGSGQIAAHADFVSFIFRPWMYATERERDDGNVSNKDAEMIWSKNRHGLDGVGTFFFDPASMAVI